MVSANYCKWRSAIRGAEGDRPLHSDRTPSLNMRFLAGSGTPVSAAHGGCESKLEKVGSVWTSSVEAPS